MGNINETTIEAKVMEKLEPGDVVAIYWDEENKPCAMKAENFSQNKQYK